MPIYEYECQACGHHLEEIQGFNDAPLLKCPECGKSKLIKLISAPSFHLKGTGWYATDFKNSGKAPAPTPAADDTNSNRPDKTDKADVAGGSADSTKAESGSAEKVSEKVSKEKVKDKVKEKTK